MCSLALLKAAAVQSGDQVALEIAPVAAPPAAKTAWNDITPVARRGGIQLMTSEKAEMLVKRVTTACEMLASSKRRACCFDRSGMYSRGNLGPPEAAE